MIPKLNLFLPIVILLLGLIQLPSRAQLVTIDMLTVGNAGNAAADATNTSHGQTGAYGYGAVGYDYRIGKTEVTIDQYVTFLNAVAASDPYGLWNSTYQADLNVSGITRSGSSGSYTYSATGSGNRPVSYVSWFDAARFSNWLHNGATASSDTETGAYTLNGATSGVITVNPNAQYWIPTEDEWYKAAYYDPTLGVSGGYTLHANGSDTLPSNSPADPGSANYNDGDFSTGASGNPATGPTTLTEVGAFTNTSNYYGTVDQGGNLFEMLDVVNGPFRGQRGGNWGSPESSLRASSTFNLVPTAEDDSLGFRVAAVIPEPGTITMFLITACASGLVLRKRFLK